MFKIGDIIIDKSKLGPHILIMEVRNDNVVKGMIIEGPMDREKVFITSDDILNFEKV